MNKILIVFFLYLLSVTSPAQTMQQIFMAGLASSGVIPIALDGSACTGTASSNAVVACSSPLTVTAGDTILSFCFANGDSGDPANIIGNDTVNGYYDAVRGAVHPNSGTVWVSSFVYLNSASGSITPQCTGWELNGWGIYAQAIKGTRTALALDSGGVNLSHSATTAATNPTAGTAASPTNANEMVLCQMVRPTASATSAGTGYLPTGTLTAVANTVAQYFQYQIQTTATAANCPYTSGSAKYIDVQYALLNASSSSGYRALTGVYGAPAAAQTNGATATIVILNTNAGSLSPLNGNPGWFQQSGAATTFDTSVHPLGSYPLLVNGVPHIIGDAATSIKVPSANTTTAYGWAPEGFIDEGRGMWVGQFVRLGTNQGLSQICDNMNLDGTLVEGQETTQIGTNSSGVIFFQIEINSGGTPGGANLFPSTPLNLNQDYYIISHVAGVNDANDDIYVLAEATPGTLPWVVIDHITWPRAGPIQATATGTASSGATSVTVASSTAQPVVGQTIWSGTGGVGTSQITPGTLVTSVSGTCSSSCTVGISAVTTASMSTTPLIFTGATARTTASTTAGSTTLTVTSGTGLASGDRGAGSVVGMVGVQAGTWLAAGSGTSWTLSQPATLTETSATADFWPTAGTTYDIHFGKYSSCSSTADYWFSGLVMDPYGTYLPLVASGALPI